MSAYRAMLHGIFTTAMEGGVNYWASVDGYRWSTGDGETDDLDGFTADLYDQEDDLREYVVNGRVIARGYRLATGPDAGFYWSTERPPLVVTDETDWDYDAGDADAIVQLGLFGEVRYG